MTPDIYIRPNAFGTPDIQLQENAASGSGITANSSIALPFSSAGAATVEVRAESTSQLPFSSSGTATVAISADSTAQLPFSSSGTIELSVVAPPVAPPLSPSAGGGVYRRAHVRHARAEAEPLAVIRIESRVRLPLRSIGRLTVEALVAPELPVIVADSRSALPFTSSGRILNIIRATGTASLSLRSGGASTVAIAAEAESRLPFSAHGRATISNPPVLPDDDDELIFLAYQYLVAA